jgi:flagellar protein FlaG
MAIPIVSSSNNAGTAGPVQKTTGQAQAAPQADSAAGSAWSPEQIQQATRNIERAVGSMTSELNFSVDQESGKTVVRVIDSATQQLIRQIPSEELMAASRAIDRLAGLLVQEKA